jgi:hypothetical protein
MRKLIVIAALALFSTSAHAKVHEFKFGGRSMRIEVPKHCSKPSCIHVYERSGRSKKRSSTAAAVVAAPVVAALPQTTAADTAPRIEPKAEPKTETQSATPDERKAVARLTLPTNPADEAKTASNGSLAGANADPAKATPVGLWLTEKREGKIRIEECGQNLCGHAENKPNEKVLIDMKPTQNNRWSGKIHDTRSDTANISLKNPNALKVQGCVFGGLFCGGETWTRVD